MNTLDLKQTLANAMTESELAENVRHLAKALNYMAYHTWRSDHSPAGFPDWVFVKEGRLLFVELKRQKGKITTHQRDWLDCLRECHLVEVYEWRPSEWINGTIEEILKGDRTMS